MRVNVYVRFRKTKKGEQRFYLVVRRYGHHDECIQLGPITKKLAHEKRITVLNEILTGTYQTNKSVLSPFIDAFIPKFLEWAKGVRSENTVRLYADNLKAILSDFKGQHLHEITREKIERYLSNRTVSNRTKNIELNSLIRLFEKAIDWGYLRQSPCHGIKCLKEQSKGSRSLTTSELSRLFDLASPWQLSLIKVAVHSGFRRGELLNLKFTDIEWENNRIECIGKGSKKRYVYMSQDLRRELEFLSKFWPNHQYGCAKTNIVEKYLPRTENQTTFVFCLGNGEPIKQNLQSIRTLFKKAKLDGVTLHGFRKTFCSLLAKENVHPKVAQILMGHSDVRLTMDIYTEAQPEQMAEAVNHLPSFRSLESSKLKLVKA